MKTARKIWVHKGSITEWYFLNDHGAGTPPDTPVPDSFKREEDAMNALKALLNKYKNAYRDVEIDEEKNGDRTIYTVLLGARKKRKKQEEDFPY